MQDLKISLFKKIMIFKSERGLEREKKVKKLSQILVQQIRLAKPLFNIILNKYIRIDILYIDSQLYK